MNVCRRCDLYNSFGLCKGATYNTNVITGLPFGCAQPPEKMRHSEAYCGAKGRWYQDKIFSFDKLEDNRI